jgi:hypothetical protein
MVGQPQVAGVLSIREVVFETFGEASRQGDAMARVCDVETYCMVPSKEDLPTTVTALCLQQPAEDAASSEQRTATVPVVIRTTWAVVQSEGCSRKP